MNLLLGYLAVKVAVATVVVLATISIVGKAEDKVEEAANGSN